MIPITVPYCLPTTQMPQKRKYVPDKFKAFSKLGSKYVIKNANVQFAEKAIDEHSLLASGAKTSAFKVHAKGPNPKSIKSQSELPSRKFS